MTKRLGDGFGGNYLVAIKALIQIEQIEQGSRRAGGKLGADDQETAGKLAAGLGDYHGAAAVFG